MKTIYIRNYLALKGRSYPEPDSGDCISALAFEHAGLPMVVECAGCTMTMALHEHVSVDPATGRIYCEDCANTVGED